MSFCNQPWAAEMPARTKAQRAVRLKRAKEEEDLMLQRFILYRDMGIATAGDYLRAVALRERLERKRAEA